MPGVGFGMGMERLLMVMEGAGIEIPRPEELKVFLCTMGEQARTYGFGLLKRLRDAGISADMDHSARSLKAQMKYANKLQAQYAAVLGEDELNRGVIKLRNMAASEEREISLETLAEELK